MILAAMNVRSIKAGRLIVLVVLSVSFSVNAFAEQGLFLTGYTAMYSTGGIPMEQEGGLSSDVLCGANGVAELLEASQSVLQRVTERIGGAGVPSAGELEAAARATQADLCQGGSFHVEPQALTYASCRMTMDQHSNLMDMRLPTTAAAGAMEVADFWKAEVMRIPLFKAEEAGQAPETGGAMQWTGPGDSQQIAGYPATRWDFSYAANMSMGGAVGMSINMNTRGHGYFSRNVSGFEILDALYTAFLDGISFEQGGGSFFGGMMKTWVEVLERGLPLLMDQTTTSSMGGMSMGGGEHRTVMKINSLQMVDLPSDFCTRALTPEYFEVSEPAAGLSGMSITAGSPSGSADTEESGGMLGGLMNMMKSAGEQGFAVPGQQQAPAANPAGQPVPQQAPAPAPSGGVPRSGPSSADLMTDDVTQSVQLHLEALGYSVGNTKGDLDTNTIIAISQFQAERGMQVTGEATPQLLGILGAAVDAK